MHKGLWAFVLIGAVALVAVSGCGSQPKETVSVIDENHFDQLAATPGEAGNAAGGIEVLADGTIPAAQAIQSQIPIESANAQIAATESAALATSVPSAKESAPKGATFEQKVQTALKNAGFYSGIADGKIGPKTREAIKAFQTANSLKADGVVGPTTWEKLKKYVSN